MFDIVLWLFVGALIGWNFPQPWWAKIIQGKIVNLFQKKDS